ncbi:MAG: GIY-YIG nuclease family protein [Bacteroidetes bacterium]|nr:GIY-YIG nuclease family protein [Bacteroidota bacterium]HVZ41770.1 GIY-YIG nuclease family protein [Candidatus Kapabacteria bacterium]
MSSYVYVLKSAATGQHYIGSTNNLERRITEYNRLSPRAAGAGDTWECVYVEVCDDLDAARTRERYLKSIDGVDEKITILYPIPSRRRFGRR